MIFHIITIFPEMIDSYLKESILGRAVKNKKINVCFYNPRDFIKRGQMQTKRGQARKDWWYKQVDDRPYGGGPGMVMMIEPIIKAVQSIKSKIKNQKSEIKAIIFSARGRQFDNKKAISFAKDYTDLILICGRYEGIDERVKKIIKDMGIPVEKISVGPYVLTGGEVPAMILVDSISRQIPGVLHNKESLEENRFGVGVPVYTRPEVFRFKIYKSKLPARLQSDKIVPARTYVRTGGPARTYVRTGGLARNIRSGGRKGTKLRKEKNTNKKIIEKEYRVPKILLSGHNQKIEDWKKKFIN